jgi:hypothetical protein
MRIYETDLLLDKLKDKADNYRARMPSIKKIHELLNYFGIQHYFRSSTNVVEYRSAGRRYVNSRHDGKQGYKIEVKKPNGGTIELDTSDSYYSINASIYARHLLEIIKYHREMN